MRQVIIAILASIFAIGSAAAEDYKLGDLVISHPWSRATPPGAKVGGAYAVIMNTSASADRLISVAAAAVSDNVQIHEMGMKDGIMTMRPLPDGVTIPAGGKIEFKPGGYHIMLIDLKAPLKAGDHIKARLVFEHAGPVDVEFDVGAIGQTTPPHAHDMPM